MSFSDPRHANVGLYEVCPRCKGDGIALVQTSEGIVEEDPCTQCDGKGLLNSRVLFLDTTPLPGIYYTYQIFEATDLNEYLALSDGNKSLYASILSLGQVDTADGTSVRLYLYAMFPIGTTTRTNLSELFE